MKRILYIFALLVISYSVQAQQYPLFTNYSINKYAFNPAYTGTVGCLDAQALYRSQWVGFEGAPITKAISVNKMFNSIPLGVGAMFIDDQAGQLKRTGVNLNFAYLMNRDKNVKYSFGASVGGHNLRLSDGSTIENPSDPLMGIMGDKNWLFDLGVGVMAYSDKFYVGLSSPQLSYSKLDFNETESNPLARLQRHFYLMGGYEFKLSEKLDLEPSALLKYEKSAPLQLDLTAKMTYKKMLWIGASYRHKAALAGLVGINYKQFNLGYAYDFNLVDYNSSGYSSHEFSLGYTVKCKSKMEDKDNDGVADEDDECPELAGTIKGKGCPELDGDGDGIVDSEDECPELAGKDGKGCPTDDRDRDGIVDALDKCPDIAGIEGGGGCPYIDSDNDGVKDELDGCPNIAGDPANNGCPARDDDGDGIPNSRDNCPNTYGTLDGCPETVVVTQPQTQIDTQTQPEYVADQDRDQDGIINDFDNCPDTWGVQENNGCPVVVDNDRDDDGVPDDRDRCPDVWGDAYADGCPTSVNTDFDNDGISDNEDDCPNTWGVASNRGCPVLTDHHMTVLKLAIKHVYFDTDKYVIKPESKKYLKDLAQVMRKQRDWKVRITGYADHRGTEEHNLLLSKNRAFAVMDYLTSLGLDRSRFVVEFYGEEDPKGIFTNEDVLQQSRRVQLEYVFN